MTPATAGIGVISGLAITALVLVLARQEILVRVRRVSAKVSEDELHTHRLIAALSMDAAGRTDLDVVAAHVLDTCRALFDCGQATLTLADGDLAPDGTCAPRVWHRTFGACAGHGGVSCEIRGAAGAIVGAVSVFPQPDRGTYGDREHALLRTVAGAAGAAAANAQALRAAREANAKLAASEQKQRETIKRLENMNRELEEFTLWTTHDMREPLRSIGTMAEFLHEDLGRIDDEEARDMARRICDGAARLKERVKALHAFSRIVQKDDEFSEVPIQGVVEQVIATLDAKIQEKRATLVVRAPLPSVRAQPHRIHQVFANLVENALKYGRLAEPTVEIGAEDAGAEWHFYVRDDGPGIPAGYHERIFLLFQRGPATHESGSGAGLAIVKRITEQHGGRAWVESREGEGARFVVALPKSRPVPTAAVALVAP